MSYFIYCRIYIQKYCYLFYEFIIITLYFLFILLLMINNNLTSIDRLYAFNIEILCNIQEKSNFYKIKNISLFKFNNQSNNLYYSYLFNCNKFLQYIEKQNNYLFHQYINNLQFSGFVHSFHYTKIILNTKDYLAFTITYNPIIRSIKITNYNKLTISSSKLSKLFYQQLGLPKNYKLVQDAVKQIIIWYKFQGFEWVRVKLYNHYHVNQINIVIDEGRIISNKIICDNYNQISDYKYINSIIKSELNLIPGNVLNKKQLNISIKRLKQIYRIKYIKYNVDFYKNGLYITINYSMQINNYLTINYFYLLMKSFIKQMILNIYYTNLINFTRFNFLYFIKFNIKLKDLYKIQFNIYSQPINLNKYIKSIYIQSLSSINSCQKYFIYYINLYWLKLEKIHLKQTYYISSLVNLMYKGIYDINEQVFLTNQYYVTKSKYISFYIYLNSLQDYYLLSQRQYKYCICSNMFHYNIKCNGIIYLSLAKIINTIAGKINYNLINQITSYKYNLYTTQYNINQFIVFCLNQILDLGSLHKNCKNLYININCNVLNTSILKESFYNTFFFGIKSIHLYPSIVLQTKYGIYINNSSYLYIFYNYLIYPKNFIDKNLNYNFIRNSNYYIGFGTQVKIPLKQISYIRLEYIINYKNKIYIFMDKFNI
uniref:POTRA domain-containing protein n=1 Tax=Gayliella sp. TaxID=2575623 RepID=A0A4D6WS21_9FLOR|nr:hypothetical protein [Gayliella sp.]